jgi:serine/threonine-protein kinase
VQQNATRVGPAVGPGKRNRRGLITVLTILGLVGVVALILFASGIFGENAGEVRVPDVVGLMKEEATAELENAGFKVVEDPVRNEAPIGEVVDQDPSGGDRADRGSDVTISVSVGTGLVQIPSVAGLLATDAEQLLKDAGLEPRFVGESSTTVPALEVIRTVPAEGTEVDAGSTVRVYVSEGPPEARVPNVLNLDQASATADLTDAGFVVDPRSEANDDVPAGRVIRTDPAANTLLRQGETVVIYVSSGPATADVPNVVGQSEGSARATITNAGFSVSVVYQVSSPGNVGRVLSQDPAGGSRAAPNSTVVLTVGEAATTTSAAPTTSTTGP